MIDVHKLRFLTRRQVTALEVPVSIVNTQQLLRLVIDTDQNVYISVLKSGVPTYWSLLVLKTLYKENCPSEYVQAGLRPVWEELKLYFGNELPFVPLLSEHHPCLGPHHFKVGNTATGFVSVESRFGTAYLKRIRSSESVQFVLVDAPSLHAFGHVLLLNRLQPVIVRLIGDGQLVDGPNNTPAERMLVRMLNDYV